MLESQITTYNLQDHVMELKTDLYNFVKEMSLKMTAGAFCRCLTHLAPNKPKNNVFPRKDLK